MFQVLCAFLLPHIHCFLHNPMLLICCFAIYANTAQAYIQTEPSRSWFVGSEIENLIKSGILFP